MTIQAPRDDTLSTLLLPGGEDDDKRRRENLLRRRLLSGSWLDDLLTRIYEHFDEVRREALGRPTLSRNLARTVIRQLSVLYDADPQERTETESPDNETFLRVAHRAGLWEMGTRLQQRTLLVREGCRAIGTPGPEGKRRLLFRDVPLDRLWMEANPDDPDQPHRIIEARRRKIDGKQQWTWDAWDISNLKAPRYAVLKPMSLRDGQDPFQAATDWTDRVHGKGARFEGDGYGFRYADGRPFLPYALYHAERTGELYDSWEGVEMVDGALDIATLWTFWLHCVKDASWPQRYVLNAILRGLGLDGAESKEKFAVVAADPSSIMQFVSESMQAASFGQWMPGTDPSSLEMAIGSFERTTATHFHLAPSDFQTSGNAESGYAISIKRQAVREAQRRFEPQFRRGDEELLGKAAAMANRAGITRAASETDWQITYPALPMSVEERQAAKERIEAHKTSGLPASRVWQVQQLEQVDRANAIEIIVQWARDEQELDDRLAAEGGERVETLTPEEIAEARALLAAQRAARMPDNGSGRAMPGSMNKMPSMQPGQPR